MCKTLAAGRIIPGVPGEPGELEGRFPHGKTTVGTGEAADGVMNAGGIIEGVAMLPGYLDRFAFRGYPVTAITAQYGRFLIVFFFFSPGKGVGDLIDLFV